jgi:cell division protein FtsI (penicillin-binding protein 3)
VNNDPSCTSCLASTSIGYNVAVTPLQIAAAYAAIANDGLWVQPRLVASTVDVNGSRLAAKAGSPGGWCPRTHRLGPAAATRQRGRQRDGAGGVGARVPGGRQDRNGQQARSRRPYTDETVASFVGMAPIDDPKVVIAVIVDDPAWEYRTGGLAAAPAFAEVMEAALHALGVVPDAFDR